jgi:hypothetical protein
LSHKSAHSHKVTQLNAIIVKLISTRSFNDRHQRVADSAQIQAQFNTQYQEIHARIGSKAQLNVDRWTRFDCSGEKTADELNNRKTIAIGRDVNSS